MSGQSVGDYIKQYATKVIYTNFNKKRTGSAILVKVNDSTCYMFTAKHNFKEEDDDSYKDVDIHELENNLNLVEVKTDHEENICKLKSIIFQDETLDLIVFEVESLNSNFIEVLPKTNEFLKDEHFHKEKMFFYGYPENKDGISEIDLVLINTKKQNNTFILKRGLNITNKEYFRGYSGAGVFIRKNNVYYIVGIVIKADEKLDNFEVIDLSKIVSTINQILDQKSLPKLSLKEHVFDVSDVSNMYSKLFYRHPNNFLVKKIEKLFGKNHEYDELIQPPPHLEELCNYIDCTNDFDKKENDYTQELADMYLLSTFVASRYQDKQTAKDFFKKACKYRPQYNIFLTQIDRENSKEELLKSGKVAFSEQDYAYAEECFVKVLSLKCNESELLNIYNYLLDISKYYQNKEKQFRYYQRILELELESLRKAQLLYELSFLIDNRDEKLKLLTEADREIGYDSEALELKYLVKKELYGLLENKESYKIMKNLLKKLVLLKPEYQKELDSLEYKDAQKKVYRIVKVVVPVMLILIILTWL